MWRVLAGCNSGCGRKEASKAHLWEGRPGQARAGGRAMEGGRLSGDLARSSPGAPPRCVCLLRILSFYSLCRVELFTHKNQEKYNWKLFWANTFLWSLILMSRRWEHSQKTNYSPIVHRRYGLLHPGPGVQGLRLEGRAVHVSEHCHRDQPLETRGMWGEEVKAREAGSVLMWRDMLPVDDW